MTEEQKKERVAVLQKELVELLDTIEPEYLEEESNANPNNWQASSARNISDILLYVSKADGLCGCPLCQL